MPAPVEALKDQGGIAAAVGGLFAGCDRCGSEAAVPAPIEALMTRMVEARSDRGLRTV